MASSRKRTGKSITGGQGVPTLYYADGYHGGIKGHMPPGAWRDILNALKRHPEWKVCLDIEPISWDYVEARDPAALAQLRQLVLSGEGRAEIMNGSYAQPFAWVIGGESNIRQLIRGREIIQRHFPGARVEVYTTQEPCWTSCLPQILLSLGLKWAVLKDPSTAWSGYSEGFDAEVVRWVGPDGSAIPTVPRYACENLANCWETESVFGTAEFSRKCAAHGIQRPTGMDFQDLGWPAKPCARGEHIRNVTWGEYFEKVAGPARKSWRVSQEDFHCVLPWGERALQRLARQIRSAESRILVAEKLAALARVWRGLEVPQERLREAWDQLLLAQHHDAWVCCFMREQRNNWAWQVGAQTWVAEEICDRTVRESLLALAPSRSFPKVGELERLAVRVFNSTGYARKENATASIACDAGTRDIQIFDEKGRRVSCQIIPTRGYADASINHARVIFPAEAPAMGYRTYAVRLEKGEAPKEDPAGPGPGVLPFRGPVKPQAHSYAAPGAKTASAAARRGGCVVLETDLWRIVIDPQAGGAIRSLYGKAQKREFCPGQGAENLFNEYRAYLPVEEQWISSKETPAKVEIVEAGPLQAQVRIEGQIGAHSFVTVVSANAGSRVIDCHVRFQFQRDTWVGKSINVQTGDHIAAQLRKHEQSFHNDRYKLLALFPTSFTIGAVHKNAAYDVCKSRHEGTFYDSWEEIKHNIILDWVDVTDAKGQRGMALFCDHTTSYCHDTDHPLGLVLGWGGEWGKVRLLKGLQEARYALVPHEGEWDKARIWEECARWKEPLLTRVLVEGGKASAADGDMSLVQVSGEGVEIPTILVEGEDLLVRLFNASGSAGKRNVSLGVKAKGAELVDLQGKRLEKLEVAKTAEGRYAVRLAIPRFGIRTVRFRGAARKSGGNPEKPKTLLVDGF